MSITIYDQQNFGTLPLSVFNHRTINLGVKYINGILYMPSHFFFLIFNTVY